MICLIFSSLHCLFPFCLRIHHTCIPRASEVSVLGLAFRVSSLYYSLLRAHLRHSAFHFTHNSLAISIDLLLSFKNSFELQRVLSFDSKTLV